MGIPHLTKTLEPYASRSPLSGRLVLDGPSFAFHVLHLCRRDVLTSSPLEEPTYKLLGAAALRWLDQVQECGLVPSAIYFDGYLPAFKVAERLGRFYAASELLNCLSQNEKHGFRARAANEPRTCATRHPLRKKSRDKLPYPAFLVPAVLCALRASDRYGHITQLVPGEADSFCADHVRKYGGVVATSDSDLLLYDLGDHGSVVFLKDLEVKLTPTKAEMNSSADNENTAIIALKYVPREICDKMALQPRPGLLSFAFEMTKNKGQPLASWIEQSKRHFSVSPDPPGFPEFASPYLQGPRLDTLIPQYLNFLDGKVSEFVLQWTDEAPPPLKNRAEDGGFKVFLPHLLYCLNTRCPWKPSLRIRQLAYTSLQFSEGCRRAPSITEYRRLQTAKSKGNAVDLLDEFEALATCSWLLDAMMRAKVDSSSSPLQWTTLCMYLELAQAEEQQESLTASLWKRADRSMGRLEPGGWDTIHLTAQLQAALYSFRMLQQVQCVAHVRQPELRDTLAKLTANLSSLPSVADFPAIADTESLFERLRASGELDLLADLAGLPEAVPFEECRRGYASTTAKKNVKNDAHEMSRRLTPEVASTNPFDALQNA